MGHSCFLTEHVAVRHINENISPIDPATPKHAIRAPLAVAVLEPVVTRHAVDRLIAETDIGSPTVEFCDVDLATER
jgi:hypothetical protein